MTQETSSSGDQALGRQQGKRSGDGSGVFFEIDVVAFPVVVRAPLREWGRSLASGIQRLTGVHPNRAGRTPLADALEALRRDAHRLEVFAFTVAVEADEKGALKGLVREAGVLLRSLVRDLDQGLATVSLAQAAEDDLQDVRL